MSRDPSDVGAEGTAADPHEEELVDRAQERIDEVEDEFGPDAPPRGATPGNPDAEQKPS